MLNRFRVSTRVAPVCLALAMAAVTARHVTAESGTVEAGMNMVESRAATPVRAEAAIFDPTTWATTPGGVDRTVLSLALEAAGKAVVRGDTAQPATLTVIDFSKPSTEKRLWVYDLRSHAVLFHEYVAHGRGSGENLATRFSNVPESNRSSLGLFRTGEAYIGKHGLSLRLDGLEPGINDRARERAIVIHGADYVNAATAVAQGRLGRSLGCPAVSPQVAAPLIQAVKNGGLLFAYYPEQSWLAASTYLN